MKLLRRPLAERGVVCDVTPENAGWDYVGFRVVRLADGETYDGVENDRETCIVVLTGTCDIAAGNERFADVGGRSSVFERPPTALYVAVATAYRIVALTETEIAICTAPATGKRAIQLLAGSEMTRETRGIGSNTRHVTNILHDADDVAERLLVVEVITPGGNWSSYPPHKHDRDAFPDETLLEETYYHRLSPPQGYAVQRVYTDDRSLDETMTVEDGDVVLVPRGYHPVGAAHGYDLYYLNVMAGPRRDWRFANDPQHEWLVRRSNIST